VIFRFVIILALVAVVPNLTHAQELSQKEPIEITADGALEWQKQENKYVARGNAVAKQGEMQVSGDVLEAFYNPAVSSTDITNFVATGNVLTETPDGTVRGQKATYDVASGEVIFTGNNLKLEGDGSTITADKSLKYNRIEQKFTATGNARATEPEKSITGDTLIIYFDQSNKKTTSFKRAEAVGNVTILSGKEKATGNKATYTKSNNLAVLEGDVKITQGTTILEGARATMNTETGVSQLYADPGTKRVKAVFFPK
tara:strand:- start:879 stop:1649 length:771 start_codon:yes stop_codon:yes gene_type:complete